MGYCRDFGARDEGDLMTKRLTDLYAALSDTAPPFPTATDDPGADDFTRTLTFTVESVDHDRNAVLLRRLCL